MDIVLAMNSDETPQNLWWAVDCLPNNQMYTFDSVLPNISPEQYRSINVLPDTINTLNLKNCKNTFIKSDNIHVCITGDPKSVAPHDFLQYIINIPTGTVLDKPTHYIKVDEKSLFFNMRVEALLDKNIVELWLINEPNIGSTIDNIQEKKDYTNLVWIIIFIFIGYILLASGIIIAKSIIKKRVN